VTITRVARSATVRVMTWNVAGRVARQPEQAAVVAAGAYDLVCLQEVTPTTLPAWRRALGEAGLSHVRSSMDEWLPGEPPPEGRRLGVLIASRAPLEVVVSAHPPWPERLLSARVAAEVPFVAHSLHSPISQKPDHVKLRTHRAVHAHLARAHPLPQLLVGDLNTPRREFPDGTTWSFARTAAGALRLDRGERWERDELAPLRGLEEHGMRDFFRALHGYGREEISFAAGRRGGGWRLDHMVGSAELRPVACEYEHAPREDGLSDHSPMWSQCVLLRRATPADAPAIGAVFDAAVREGWAYLGEVVQRPLYEPGHWDALVADHAEPDALLVATDGAGRVAGFAAVHAHDGEVYLLFVDPGQAGRGIGRALLEASHDILRAAGTAEAFLFTEERNLRARAVYAAAGYMPDGSVRESVFRGQALREVRLVKALSDARV
jgi:exonuclease III/GNAT superfamily N-acetyltransferase